jgi:hypothetical protein
MGLLIGFLTAGTFVFTTGLLTGFLVTVFVVAFFSESGLKAHCS